MLLSDIDLNLLVYLDALLVEQHVTNASKRVGLSQSAMSRALSRLREVFQDELLVKTTQGMAPTPLATKLGPQIRRILREVDRAITGEDSFDPEVDIRTLRIVADNTCQLVLIPALLEALVVRAPNLIIEIQDRGVQMPRGELEKGLVDLVLGRAPLEDPALRTRELMRDELVVLRPAQDASALDLKTYTELAHVDVQSPTQSASAIDMALRQLGKKRHISLRVAHMATLPEIIRRTGAIATLPARAGALLAAEDLVCSPPPLKLPGVILSMSWHVRAEDDAAHQWLRALLEELAQTLRA